jgi:deazaflavin-dependent oxidoreductase (nitroreductase family)
MLTVILVTLGVLLIAVAIVLTVFAVGMRRKTPWVLNAVRLFARDLGNPRIMKKAGTPGAYASVIKHTGRRSGRSYATPVAAAVTDEGFAIATVYGTNTDWLKNVLADGRATIVHEGRTYPVDRPELVPLEEIEDAFERKELRTLHRYRVTTCLRLRRTSTLQPAVEPKAEPAVEPVATTR